MKLKEKYGFGDFLWIPVKSAPYTTLLLIAENIIEALIPAATVLVTADFIDTSLEVLAFIAIEMAGRTWKNGPLFLTPTH